MSRVLVTGAGGFVGQWLLPALAEAGHTIVALASEPPAAVPPGVPRRPEATWLVGDLRDDAHVADAVALARPEWVIHLAAISHVPTAEADPVQAWDVNVTATARLLQALGAARDAGEIDPRVLIVGSAEQYGRHEEPAPLAEETPQRPRTVYAATKAAQEVLALQQWRARGLAVVCARSFNHSGAGQPSRFLLPALVARARTLADAPAGTPFPVGNRAPIRDFLHVSDVVSAYISLVRHGVPGEAYNVSSGIGFSVQQVLDRVMARAGSRAVPVEDPGLVRPVDVPVLVGDARKLQHATGWQARRSFDDILDDLFRYAEAH